MIYPVVSIMMGVSECKEKEEEEKKNRKKKKKADKRVMVLYRSLRPRMVLLEGQ
jgi:hypothetical protein